MPSFVTETIITVQDGTKIVHKFLVTEFRNRKACSVKVGDHKNVELFRAITEDEYNKMIHDAEVSGFFIWKKVR